MNKNTLNKSFFSLKYKSILLFFVLFSTFVNAQTTYYSTTASLVTAVNLAGTNGTGGTFVLNNNTYNNATMTFTAIATAAKPIIIKAATIGGVIFTGKSGITLGQGAAHLTFEGFKFDCTSTTSLTIIKFQGNNNIRITRNDFKGAVPTNLATKVIAILLGGYFDDKTIPYQFLSHNNRIDHNFFHDKENGGNFITIDGTNSSIVSQNDRIDHNHFKNLGPRQANEMEAVRMGWSAMSNSSGNTILENNLFENCDGDPEVVSVKSCDNIIRNNTFIGNYGSLVLRSGRRNVVQGNYFFGNGRPVGLAGDLVTPVYTGGIRIYGVDHVVVNNYMEGLNGTRWDAPITLTQGNVVDNGGNSNLTNHHRAQRIMIANNTLVNNVNGIQIGFKNSTGSNVFGQALLDVTLANNIITGSSNSMIEVVDNASISGVTFINNLMYPIAPATLTSGTTTVIAGNNANPFLAIDSATSTANYTNWKATATTPSYVNPSYTNITQVSPITNDIDGHTRTSPNSSVGADYYSTATVLDIPITAAVVGPYAYENIPLALTPVANLILAGETKSTTVTTALAWTASVNSSWLSIDNASGTGNGTINITATANTSGVPRSGILTVTPSGETPVTITVNQDGPTITLSAVTNFVTGGGTKATAVTSNVAWTASIDNSSWLSISPTSGTNNGSINIAAVANTLITTRTGTLTLTGGGVTKTLTITQDAAVSTTPIINAGANGFPVTATATITQAPNVAMNTLDKVLTSRWSDDGTRTPYGVITYDFGDVYTLESIKIATTGTATKWYFYGIQFSTDGVNYTNVVNVESAKANENTFETYPFTNVARYVKITGGGNNGTGFTTISEIEFYGKVFLSVGKNEFSKMVVYPNPATTIINVQIENSKCTSALLYAMDGRLVQKNKILKTESNLFSIEVTNLKNGNYVLKLEDDSSKSISSKIITIAK